MDSARRAAIGFVSGALAVLIFHQSMYYVLGQVELVQSVPWRMNPVPPYGVPWLLNNMFWGGLWGLLYALLFEPLVPLPFWLGGVTFGLIFPQLLGTWLIVPLLRGQQLFGGYFSTHDAMRLVPPVLLNAVAFGLGLGVIYKSLSRRS